MDNRPTHPGVGPVCMVPEFFAVYIIKNFRDGMDSWEFLKYKDDINALKDYLDENGEIELLRDILEVEYKLKKLPVEEPCWAQ